MERRIGDNADMFGPTIDQQYAEMKKEIKYIF